MYRQDWHKANAITDQIETVLMKLQLAQVNNQPDEINAFTITLEELLGQYMDLRLEHKQHSVI